MVELEALLELFDLRRQRHRIAGVAVEHLDRDGAAIGSAEQAVGDLQRALATVAAVSTLGERAAAAFHVARRDVVQHERAVREVTFGQRSLDGGLALTQAVRRRVWRIPIGRTEAGRAAGAGGGGRWRESAGSGELCPGSEEPRDEEGEDEVAAAMVVLAENPLEAILAG